jgi:nucleoside-diphosphate-sugar epimerase
VSERSLRGERVLVTGASGFIGGHLVNRLVSAGAEVHGVAREARSTGDVVWWQADLSDEEAADRIVEASRPSLVYHLAGAVTGGRDLSAVGPSVRDTLGSAVHVLTAAARHGTGRVVLAGSLEEPDTGDPFPVSPYAAAKAAAASYAGYFRAVHGLPVVVLRVFMVYGPGQRDRTKLVPSVIDALLRGDRPAVSSGLRPVDWIHVEDVADAFLAAGTAPEAPGEPIDVGTGRMATVREVVELLVRLVDPALEARFGASPDRPFERVVAADARRTEEALGWRAAIPLEAGLRDTVRWFADRRTTASLTT